MIHSITDIIITNSVEFHFFCISRLKFFQEPCNHVDGYDIQFFGLKDQGEKVNLFFQPFCRSLPLRRERFVDLILW